MKKSIKNFKNLTTSIDVLNTINGGVSEPYLSLREVPQGQQMRVRVPGLDKEALKVEIHNNELTVYYHIAIESIGKVVQMPQMVYEAPIPYFISVDSITATYDDRELIVDLPFNEKADGYHRKIETQ